MSRGLLDTSVVISLARGEKLSGLPEEGAISTLTLCGLHHGVLVADDEQRAGRLAMLALAERRFQPLPVDQDVAPHFGRIMADARRRRLKPGTADALIAATAAANELPLYTLDSGLAKLGGAEIVLMDR
ncbi:MAG: PIN domain-containing protein [Solirubrobacterales bacterium]|nr:PIN domain-containing protein [Solirubrobacterales bacterium]